MSMLKQYDFGSVVLTIPTKRATQWGAVCAMSFQGPEHKEKFTGSAETYCSQWFVVELSRPAMLNMVRKLRTSQVKPKISR